MWELVQKINRGSRSLARNPAVAIPPTVLQRVPQIFHLLQSPFNSLLQFVELRVISSVLGDSLRFAEPYFGCQHGRMSAKRRCHQSDTCKFLGQFLVQCGDELFSGEFGDDVGNHDGRSERWE